jgi:hypothetical protein
MLITARTPRNIMACRLVALNKFGGVVWYGPVRVSGNTAACDAPTHEEAKSAVSIRVVHIADRESREYFEDSHFEIHTS